MRFEFKLRIGCLAIEASDHDNFVPFQLTLWRYEENRGHSVCSLRWNSFKWHGWNDRAQIRFVVTPRIGTITFEPEPDDQWDDIVV